MRLVIELNNCYMFFSNTQNKFDSVSKLINIFIQFNI